MPAISSRRTRACGARFENEDGRRRRLVEESVSERGTGDAGADDEGVYGLGEIRRGSVIGETRGRILPVGYCGVGGGQSGANGGPLFHCD